jgi:hypothetical protein
MLIDHGLSEMRSLTTPAVSAFAITEWLLKQYRNSAVPLASCRALLSPSTEELEHEPKLAKNRCSVDNFRLEANEWREDSASNRGNIAFFYFCGHGLALSPVEQLILLEDFGDITGGPLLRAGVSVNNLFLGMAPWKRQPNIASKQVYFLDSGRAFPENLTYFEKQGTTQIFDAPAFAVSDYRMATVFHGATSGQLAYGKIGELALFTSALLRGLSGAAAQPSEEEREIQRWHVSIQSLSTALPRLLEESFRNSGIPAQEPEVSGVSGEDWTLQELEEIPMADLRVHATGSASADLALELTAEDGTSFNFPIRVDEPAEFKIPAGIYKMSVTIHEADPPAQKLRPKFIRLMPPYLTLRIAVPKRSSKAP